MDKIEKIKDWLKPYLKDKVRDEHEEGFFHCAMLLNDFIDTLSDESDKSLEEAVEEYEDWAESYSQSDFPTCISFRQSFKAGAEWQKEKDTRDMYMSDNRHFQKVYELGKNDMKEQMMKDVVEGEICGRVYDHINVRFADGVCKYLEPKNISHIPADVSKYNIGDKVRIIIVKEG